jgi:hypothetical protein
MEYRPDCTIESGGWKYRTHVFVMLGVSSGAALLFALLVGGRLDLTGWVAVAFVCGGSAYLSAKRIIDEKQKRILYMFRPADNLLTIQPANPSPELQPREYPLSSIESVDVGSDGYFFSLSVRFQGGKTEFIRESSGEAKIKADGRRAAECAGVEFRDLGKNAGYATPTGTSALVGSLILIVVGTAFLGFAVVAIIGGFRKLGTPRTGEHVMSFVLGVPGSLLFAAVVAKGLQGLVSYFAKKG